MPSQDEYINDLTCYIVILACNLCNRQEFICYALIPRDEIYRHWPQAKYAAFSASLIRELSRKFIERLTKLHEYGTSDKTKETQAPTIRLILFSRSVEQHTGMNNNED